MEAEKMYLWLGDCPLQTLNYAGHPPFTRPEARADHADGSGVGHDLGDAEQHPNPKLRPGQRRKPELGGACKHQHMPQVSSSRQRVWDTKLHHQWPPEGLAETESCCSDAESQHSISAAWGQQWTSALWLNRPYSFSRPTTPVWTGPSQNSLLFQDYLHVFDFPTQWSLLPSV